MIKITMIGAGSMVFSRNLTGDILSYPEFHDATICYMDIDPVRLAAAEGWGRRVAAGVGAQARFQATTDLDAALSGADVVMIMLQVGGLGATLLDFEIPRRHGLNFTIADTTGPGGLFRALRTYPALVRLCRGIRAHCPRALVINYSNPMSMNMAVLREEGIASAVGLCHSVQGTADRLTWYLGLKPGELQFECAGINHMAAFLKLEYRGKNLYPQLFQCLENAEIVKHDRVRFDLLRRLGYFMTESSEHHAEYNPWYIPHGRETVSAMEVPIDEYLRRCDESEKEFAALVASAGDLTPLAHKPSPEYGAKVIYGYFCDKPQIVYGNMPNRGAIGNLPPHAIVETPTCVGGGVLRLTAVGDLPLPILGYVQPHVVQHDLFIEAVKTGRRECIYEACLFDPLTASVLTPDDMVTMCDELIAAHGSGMPRLTRQFPHTSVPVCGPVPSADELLTARRAQRSG